MSSAIVRSVVLLSVVLGSTVLTGKSIAQTPPVCQPPKANEYLMMVVNPTAAVQTQLQQVLPATSTATVCTYLQDRVLRVDGFADLDTANSWTQYVTDQGEFQAFVARPAASLPPASSAVTPPIATAPPATVPSFPSPTATPPSNPSIAAAPALPATVPSFPQSSEPPAVAPAATNSSPAANPSAPQTIAYNPQPLAAGYAVLVDYADRPEVATAVRQLLARDIGLVSYAQHPYLLATYTTDPAVANSILQTLSNGNFAAMIVDSRRAIVLTRSVRTGQ